LCMRMKSSARLLSAQRSPADTRRLRYCTEGVAIAVRSNLGSRLNYEFLRQPVCSLFYLQSITISPIIITTAIHAAHMTQTAAPSGMCKNFATIIVNRLTIRRDSR
jgi:hypothetical protein